MHSCLISMPFQFFGDFFKSFQCSLLWCKPNRKLDQTETCWVMICWIECNNICFISVCFGAFIILPHYIFAPFILNSQKPLESTAFTLIWSTFFTVENNFHFNICLSKACSFFCVYSTFVLIIACYSLCVIVQPTNVTSMYQTCEVIVQR